jgi:hypothetical protein
VTEQVVRLLRLLEAADLSTTELMAQLQLHHRPTVLYSYITPAVRAGLLQMTIPDKPRSSRQKYRLTDRGRALLQVRGPATR